MLQFIGEFVWVFIYLLLFAVSGVYLLARHVYSYWHRRNVKYLPPSFPFGNYRKNLLQQLSVGEVCQEIYRNTEEPFIGVYGAFRPMIIICDPNLIRNVFIRDFQHFVDRGIYHDEKNDPLSTHLFTMSGDKWKNLRLKLSTAFSSGKLKAMCPMLVECGRSIDVVLKKVALDQNPEIDIREHFACFTINIIASVVFGLDIDCVVDPHHPFRENGRKFFANNFKNGLRNFCRFVWPTLMSLLGLRFIDDDVETFFFDLVKQMIEMREQQKFVRKDIFQMLVQLRNTGKVQADDMWETKISQNEQDKLLTLPEMVAECFVFFVAGFETSATTQSYCLYELARNPDIQCKGQEEIDMVLRKHGGELNYEALRDMKYLECCLNETLRKYPPSPFINRQCTKDYKIPGTDTVIEKGIVVQIPVLAIRHDERYYPEPKIFDPDRFSEENYKSKSFIEMPYMPFGEGPRNCIGIKLGILESKIGITLMLKNFSYSLGDDLQMDKELEISPTSFVMAPKNNIMLKVHPR